MIFLRMNREIDESRSITRLLQTRRGCDQFAEIWKSHLMRNDWLDVESVEGWLDREIILVPVYMCAYEVGKGKPSRFQ